MHRCLGNVLFYFIIVILFSNLKTDLQSADTALLLMCIKVGIVLLFNVVGLLYV